MDAKTRALLLRIHDVLDNANARGSISDTLCRLCRAKTYDGQGIVHEPDCIIEEIRQALAEHEV